MVTIGGLNCFSWKRSKITWKLLSCSMKETEREVTKHWKAFQQDTYSQHDESQWPWKIPSTTCGKKENVKALERNSMCGNARMSPVEYMPLPMNHILLSKTGDGHHLSSWVHHSKASNWWAIRSTLPEYYSRCWHTHNRMEVAGGGNRFSYSHLFQLTVKVSGHPAFVWQSFIRWRGKRCKLGTANRSMLRHVNQAVRLRKTFLWSLHSIDSSGNWERASSQIFCLPSRNCAERRRWWLWPRSDRASNITRRISKWDDLWYLMLWCSLLPHDCPFGSILRCSK